MNESVGKHTWRGGAPGANVFLSLQSYFSGLINYSFSFYIIL